MSDSGRPGDDGGLWSEREFRELARRLRRAAEDELAEIEYETERAEHKREDLSARAFRAMMEGERWQVMTAARTVEGLIVHAGLDFLGLRDLAGNRHDIVHRAIGLIRLASVEPRDGTTPASRRPATFRARLLGLELTGPVDVRGRSGGWALTGTIDSVNSDHLVLREVGGAVSIVPIDAIASVTRPSAEQRRAGR